MNALVANYRRSSGLLTGPLAACPALAMALGLGLALACYAPVPTSAADYYLTTDYENYWFWVTNQPGPGGDFTNYFGTTAGTLTYGGHVLGNTNTDLPTDGTFGLYWSSFGQSVQSIQCDFSVGDIIVPPPDANTNLPPANFVVTTYAECTNAWYQSTNDATFWVPSTRQVIAGQANNITICWITTNGTIHTVTYNVNAVPNSRPARLFWTEWPYNAPTVSLQGLFAAIHYNNQVTPPTVTYITNQDNTITTNESGVWIDQQTQQLHAKNVSGTFVLEYYETGTYRAQVQPVGIEVVQVLAPSVQTMRADVGARLMPRETYWAQLDSKNGVIPNVTKGLGDTVYVHGKAGPKENWAFALRPTFLEPWSLEIYWQHKGVMGVLWPYEVDRFSCNWPAYPQLFVVGDSGNEQAPALTPAGLTAELQAAMDPPWHAQISDSGRSFTATAPGLSLIKYSTSENIWFEVVRSVSCTDYFYFDLEPREWPIGEELTPGDDQSWALGFDGMAKYLSITESYLNRQTNWTLSLWFKVADFRPATLYSEGNLDAAFALNIRTNGQLEIATWNTNANPRWTTVETPNAPVHSNHWHYLTLTYSGGNDTNGTLRVYLDNFVWTTNGVPRVNFDGRGTAALGALTGLPTVTNHFYGKMDQLRIWTTALAWDEVSASADTTLPETTGSLVADYEFNEGQGQVVHSAAGDKDAYACGGAFWCYGRVVPGGQWSGFPGYLHLAPGEENKYRYNVGRYSYPTEDNPEASSYIFAVNTGNLEVWWAHRSRQTDMPAVYYPCQVVRYTNVWPSKPSQIVIASGLGSSGDSLAPADNALHFNGSSTNYVTVPSDPAMELSELTAEAWVKLSDPWPQQWIVDRYFQFSLGVCQGQVQAQVQTSFGVIVTLSGGIVPTNTWTHIALVYAGWYGFFICVNGQVVASNDSYLDLLPLAADLWIGRAAWTTTPSLLGDIGEVRIWNVARSPEEIAATWQTQLFGDEWGLAAYYPFARQPDGSVLKDLGPFALHGTITGAEWTSQGRLVRTAPLLLSSPALYYQNDPSKAGYNPNEEHALVLGGVAYALRDDLNTNYTSEPYVLLDYLDPATARPKMLALKVFETNELYNFTCSVDAGNPILPPMPLATMPLCTNNSSCTSPSPAWQDRKKAWWAVSAGADGGTKEARMHFYYQMQPSFFFPDAAMAAKYPVGAEVPWLPRASDHPPYDATAPVPVVYTVSWPSAPTLHLGQTLTKASQGLPEIWGQLSVDVVYQQSTNQPEAKESVELFDPVVARGAPLAKAVIDDMTGNQLARYDAAGGVYRFPNLPPSLYPRIYFDPQGSQLMLGGVLEEPLTGDPYLLLNLLEDFEKGQVNAAASGISMAHYNAWTNAVGNLPGTVTNIFSTNAYVHAALAARVDAGYGYVTLAFNNSSNSKQVPPGLTVSLAVIRVDTNLYSGALQVLLPPDVLSEQLSLRQSADFAGHVADMDFRWRWAEPAGGVAPDTDPLTPPWQIYGNADAAQGTNEVTIAGASPFTLSDHYFAVQYRPHNTTGPSGSNWSEWRSALAPGWVKRVMNGVNPFLQMLPDMTANPVDTKVTMISQAGGPYEGDVALNMNAVSQAGLIPVYETVFNRAMRFSLLAGLKDRSMNETLLYAASRLHDLYMLLGNEAYADAMDPTIAFPQSLSTDTHGGAAASIFPFMNQEPNLLEEELALLRGRDDTLDPPVTGSPVYNRLIWNFTAGISGGEPAYAYNYNIVGNPTNTMGTITAEDARRLYPQGHGDAWGHYLSAICHYYDLLSYTNFVWQTEPSATLVGNAAVSTDFFDEQKFAETAAARARTGAEIVKRCFREQYAEDPNSTLAYTDSHPDRAWGLGEWASRAGQAAYYDWIVANSLMVDNLTSLVQIGGDDVPPEGIEKIDRNSMPELAEIVTSLKDIQSQVDSANGTLNPLGLARNVVPLDIDPTAIDAGKTHFEQIYDRALQAVYNACIVFDEARGATLSLRERFDSVHELQEALAQNEADYHNRLIALYGYPYSDDIGPTGTYPAGYDGPDLINWRICDLENLLANPPVASHTLEIGLTNWAFIPNNDFTGTGYEDYEHLAANATNEPTPVGTITIYADDLGLQVKDPGWTGHRRAQGELQLAMSDAIQAWYTLDAKMKDYDQCLYSLEAEMEHRKSDYKRYYAEWAKKEDVENKEEATKRIVSGLKLGKELTELTCEGIKEIALATADMLPSETAGIFGVFPVEELSEDLGTPAKAAIMVSTYAQWLVAHSFEIGIEGREMQQARWDAELQSKLTANEYHDLLRWNTEDTLVKLKEQYVKQSELIAQVEAFQAAVERVRKLQAEGDRLIVERAQVRSRAAQRIQMARYGDISFRIFRDDALRRYQQAFELAARYTYLAAKAYDYETGLLQSDTTRTPGSKFLEDVVRARAPGKFYTWLGAPMVGGSVGEPGLADCLARMKADWDVVKGRFGFNNPETETSRFSLRTELYRIAPGTNGDFAWESKLDSYKVANLNELPEFIRYCRPYIDTTNIEPALVIPFSTFITAGQNYFGNDLAGGDNAYDASRAATKVRSMGVWFTGYISTNGNTSIGLANEPRVYLIPVGEDVMRSPTRNALQYRHWQVADQAIPLPYNISGMGIDNPDWQPVVDSLREPLAQLRRFASFRAYHDSGSFGPSETCTNGRLVGRSVWNTRWLLIIPGRTLLSDPAEGIERFVHGALGSSGRDGSGVKDIKIFFQTYSIPGD